LPRLSDWIGNEYDGLQATVRSVLAEDGSFFVNIKPHCEDGQRVLYVMDLVLQMVRGWDWRLVDELCWNKMGGVPGAWNNRFKNSFEPVYHFSLQSSIKFSPENVSHFTEDLIEYNYDNPKTHSGFISSGGGPKGGRKSGLARPNNVIHEGNAKAEIHHAQFPVALPTFFIKAFSDENDTWLDPFCGSGTVLVGCQNENRVGLGIEKLPKYGAVILERLQDLGVNVSRID